MCVYSAHFFLLFCSAAVAASTAAAVAVAIAASDGKIGEEKKLLHCVCVCIQIHTIFGGA